MNTGTQGFRTLLFEEREPSIGMVTMNRPDQLNAINVEMLEDFEQLFGELSRDDSIRVLVITGAGRIFLRRRLERRYSLQGHGCVRRP